jgi:hypothetical protein
MSGLFDQIVNYSPPLLTAGQVNYKGTWNAATNTPGLVNPPDALSKGDYYVVSADGTQFSISFAVGDWIISNGTAWEKVDLTDAVSSVFGRTGAVVGVSTDYSAVGLTNTAIGAANPSSGAFTSLSSSSTTTLNGTTVPASKTLVVTTDKLSALAATTSAELAGVISDETGSGALVFATSPTLVSPALGAATATSISASGTVTGSNLSGTNTGDQTITLTGGVTGSGTGSFAATVVTNANLTGVITSSGNATSIASQTGTGTKFVVDTSPTLVTPNLGTPSAAILTSATGLPISTGVSGLGTGIATALAVNTGSAGAPVLFNGALGTPTSGTVTNLTGTASININGTVGATTPSTVAATTVSTTGNVTLGGGADLFNGSVRISDSASANAPAYFQSGEPGISASNVILSNNYFGTSGGASGRKNSSVGASYIRLNAGSAATSNTTLGFISASGTQTDVATFSSTGLNSTAIGATTPSTAAFTTLSASGLVTVQTAGGTAAAINLYAGNNTTTSKLNIGQIGTIDWDLGVTATNGWFQIGGLGGTMAQAYTIARSGTGVLAHTFYTGGAARSEITSTGLNSTAIGATTPSTGRFTTLAASTHVQATGGGNDVSKLYASGVLSTLQLGSPTEAVRGLKFDRGTGDLSVFAGTQASQTNIASFTSTGFAVTGALSSTGALAIGNTVATAVSVASTHKVTIVIGGVTYYLLATNV